MLRKPLKVVVLETEVCGPLRLVSERGKLVQAASFCGFMSYKIEKWQVETWHILL